MLLFIFFARPPLSRSPITSRSPGDLPSDRWFLSGKIFSPFGSSGPHRVIASLLFIPGSGSGEPHCRGAARWVLPCPRPGARLRGGRPPRVGGRRDAELPQVGPPELVRSPRLHRSSTSAVSEQRRPA